MNDRKVICKFRKLHAKALLTRCFNVTEGMSSTPDKFWKKHSNVHCVDLTNKTWEGIMY